MSFVGDDDDGGPCGVVLADRLPPELAAPDAGPRPETAANPAESRSALVATPLEIGTKRPVAAAGVGSGLPLLAMT